jgi:AcrR family transcriptional regulator
VTDPVKPDRRAARRAETEARLIDAATTLFAAHGYAGTTLTDVAERAGLAPRTLYLRFESKAELLRRCIGVAIAGDGAPTPIAERPWMDAAMSAPTLEDRISKMAAVTAMLMDRAGPLLAVAQQAAATEPTIAAAAEAGRQETHRTMRTFWQRLAADGLLPAGADVEWLAETGTLLAQPETYLLLTQTSGWDIPTFEAWLRTTWLRLVASSPT